MFLFQHVERVIKKPANLQEIFGTDSETEAEPVAKKKKKKSAPKRKKREPTPLSDVSPDEKDDPSNASSSEYSN